MIAEPKERKRNDQRRRDRDKRKPGNLPFVGKPRWSFYFAIHAASPRPGSARVSRAGFGVAPKQSFVMRSSCGHSKCERKIRGREDTLASTRDACATQSQTILLQASVERASAQAECLCGLTRVTVISSQRFLDQKCLYLFETHLFNVPRFGAASR